MAVLEQSQTGAVLGDDYPRVTKEPLPAPSQPPDTFRTVHPDLKQFVGGFGYTMFVGLVLFVGLGSAAVLFAVEAWMGVLLVIGTLAIAAGVIAAGQQNYSYVYYATWILETATPTPERLKMAMIAQTRHGKSHLVTIEDSRNEKELYDVRVIKPWDYPSSLVDGTFHEAQVYRDSKNAQAVVATIGSTTIWLCEHLTLNWATRPVDNDAV